MHSIHHRNSTHEEPDKTVSSLTMTKMRYIPCDSFDEFQARGFNTLPSEVGSTVVDRRLETHRSDHEKLHDELEKVIAFSIERNDADDHIRTLDKLMYLIKQSNITEWLEALVTSAIVDGLAAGDKTVDDNYSTLLSIARTPIKDSKAVPVPMRSTATQATPLKPQKDQSPQCSQRNNQQQTPPVRQPTLTIHQQPFALGYQQTPSSQRPPTPHIQQQHPPHQRQQNSHPSTPYMPRQVRSQALQHRQADYLHDHQQIVGQYRLQRHDQTPVRYPQASMMQSQIPFPNLHTSLVSPQTPLPQTPLVQYPHHTLQQHQAAFMIRQQTSGVQQHPSPPQFQYTSSPNNNQQSPVSRPRVDSVIMEQFGSFQSPEVYHQMRMTNLNANGKRPAPNEFETPPPARRQESAYSEEEWLQSNYTRGV